MDTITKLNTGLIIIMALLKSQLDFIYGSFLNQNKLTDSNLSEQDLQSFVAPSQEIWCDYLSHENEALITMDSLKEIQWKLAKNEITHVGYQVQQHIN